MLMMKAAVYIYMSVPINHIALPEGCSITVHLSAKLKTCVFSLRYFTHQIV